MSDIFISYATEDRAQAKLLAEALAGQGWSVWWDRTMPTGSRYHQVIEEALRGARCVVVLWTAKSVASDWVRAEAGEGLARSVLVPVSLDDAPPPLVFRQIQTADLRDWQGDASAPAFTTLVADIAALLRSSPGAGGRDRKHGDDVPRPRDPKVTPVPEPQRDRPRRARWPWIALAAVVVLALGTWLAAQRGLFEGPEPKPVAEPEIALLEIVPLQIRAGERAMLRWRTANATVVEIGGLGAVAMAGERFVAPSANTIYRLVARNSEGAVEREVELVVESAPPPPRRNPPQIHRFEAAPARVEAGKGAELRWETSDADEVRIADHGPVEPSGALKVSPRQTTTYALVATNREGSARREAVVEIAGAPSPPDRQPEIVSFAADPRTIRAGGRAELVWQTANAERVELDGKPVRPTGRAGVQPTETTTYVLTALNAAGAKASRRLQVVVMELRREERLGLKGRRLTIGEGSGADLDAGVAGGERGEWDIWFGAKTPTARYLYAQNKAVIASVRTGASELGSEACTTARLSDKAIDIQGLRRGSELCVRTSRGGVAWFAVLDAVGPSPKGVLEITYVILKKP